MSKTMKTAFFLISVTLALPGVASVHSDRPGRSDEKSLGKPSPVHSGIYKLRRAPLPKRSQERKPRLKSASETIAGLN